MKASPLVSPYHQAQGSCPSMNVLSIPSLASQPSRTALAPCQYGFPLIPGPCICSSPAYRVHLPTPTSATSPSDFKFSNTLSSGKSSLTLPTERVLLWAMCYIRICDLRRRRVRSGVRDEADIDISRERKCVRLLVFSKAFYVCWQAANQIRETTKLREFPTFSHKMHFWDSMAQGVPQP